MDKEKAYIEFDDGVFGFEDSKRFVPIMMDRDCDAILLLQSVDDENLSFIIMDPFMLKEDYHPVLAKEDYERLGTDNEDDLSYYVFCVVKKPPEESTVNLKCPIVVNCVTKNARQVILESQEYGFRHRLREFQKEEA